MHTTVQLHADPTDEVTAELEPALPGLTDQRIRVDITSGPGAGLSLWLGDSQATKLCAELAAATIPQAEVVSWLDAERERSIEAEVERRIIAQVEREAETPAGRRAAFEDESERQAEIMRRTEKEVERRTDEEADRQVDLEAEQRMEAGAE